MPFELPPPIIYLITNGATTAATTTEDPEFTNILQLVEVARQCGVSLIQIREKSLSATVLYQLAKRTASIVRGSATRLLVNDRADIAQAAGADGVHLTAHSIPASLVRKTFGNKLLIAVSTHAVEEAIAARDDGADLVVFGPVYETESKRVFGEPQGIAKLHEVTGALRGFPVVAIGGIGLEQVSECLGAGAQGIAAIRLFNDVTRLPAIVQEIIQG